MTPTNPALIIAGPALVQRGGVTFYSKGNVVVTPKLSTFKIPTSRFGDETDEREDQFTYEVKFTPAGMVSAAVLAQLYPYGATIPGALVHLVRTIETVTIASDQLTITNHPFRTGHAVRVASFGTLPAGLSAATTYYARKVDANTITLHSSEAGAAAATGVIDITAAGTGTHRIIEQEYLVVHSFDGVRYQFHNSALVGVPDLNLGAIQTSFGEVTYECFRQHATDATNAAAFFSATSVANTDASFDLTAIIAQPYTLAWPAAGSAPWNSMTTKAGAKVAFGLSLDAITDDAGGVVTRKVTSLNATCTARPNNVSEADVLAALTSQGSGAGRGRRLTSNRLDITGTGLNVAIYGAALKASALNWDSKEDRIGDLQWGSVRSFAAGVPNPLYAVSTAPIT